MKKLVFLLVCLFTLQTVARADDDKPIQVTQMPQQAQQFIKQHFADSKVALAKMESDFFYKSYEVIFTNGDKVEFDTFIFHLENADILLSPVQIHIKISYVMKPIFKFLFHTGVFWNNNSYIEIFFWKTFR